MKILIIEDEKIMRQMLIERLAEEKFDVLEAENGEEGLKTALKEHPDLILLDIILPKMNGTIVLDELRKDAWGKNVPVIVLSNLSDVETAAEALENNVHDFLVKTDWSLNDVVRKIKEKLALK